MDANEKSADQKKKKNAKKAYATTATIETPTEDAIIGLDRAISHFERSLEDAAQKARDAGLTPNIDDDVTSCLRAAQAWLMKVNHEIHLAN